MTAELRTALGPLAPLLDDRAVTDILVNGGSGVWVDRAAGAEPTGIVLRDEASVRRLAVRLSSLAGQRLDDAAPWVDGLLPGGIRLHAVLPPLVAGGTHLSLRVPRAAAQSLAQLQGLGMLDEQVRLLLEKVVSARMSFVVTGGTGSGKTTLLAALLAAADPADRIVVVEDVRELHVPHPHVVHLQGRTSNVEGRGEVTMTSLVRQSREVTEIGVLAGEAGRTVVRRALVGGPGRWRQGPGWAHLAERVGT